MCVQFIRLESIAKADAQHIAAAVTCGVTKGLDVEEEEWKKKLAALATDGATVMLGRPC